MDRATKWSVTINMKTAISKETANYMIISARQKGWTVIGQPERGEEGTLHYQLAVATPQIRFSAMKKAFPGAHIEVAKDWSALLKYVQKEQTREGKLIDIKFVSYQMVRDKFFDYFLTTTHAEQQYPLTEETKMALWDEFIGYSLEQGIECDIVGVNPQYRSCIMKYWISYIRLSIRRQTDRQTQEVLVPTIDIPEQDGLSQEDVSQEEDGSSSSSERSSDGSASPW